MAFEWFSTRDLNEISMARMSGENRGLHVMLCHGDSNHSKYGCHHQGEKDPL